MVLLLRVGVNSWPSPGHTVVDSQQEAGFFNAGHKA